MRSLEGLILSLTRSIRDAMEAVDANQRGICFVVDSNSKLVGVVTDGDLRRALLSGLTLESSVELAMNKKFVSLNIKSNDNLIRNTFSRQLRLIPLCDQFGRLVDVADVQRSHKIPLLEPEFCGRELEYVQDCIESGWISSQGGYVRRFEKIFEEMHGGTHAVAVSNGTVALHLALVALGVGEGDEVIVPDITFAASINAVLYCKATPVICEIDFHTWCIDAKEVQKLITSRTKAIMPVHLYGQVCEMDKLRDLAIMNNLLLIEDCAEAIGSSFNNRLVGTLGDAGTFSFFGNKTITTGEGGMILFKNSEVAAVARVLRDHGMMPTKKYWHEQVGFNYRLTNLQAAIGVAQMERFNIIIEKKKKIADFYSDALANVDAISMLPVELKNTNHSHWLYTVLLKPSIDRDSIISDLLRNGIDARPVFYPLHQMPPYQLFEKSFTMANSVQVSKSGLSLPSSVTLKVDELEYVVKVLKYVLSNHHS